MSAAHTTKRYMNLMSVIVFVLGLLLVSGNTVFAVPYLQLDANPATYDPNPDEESVVTLGDVFTMYALVNSEASAFPDPIDLLKEYYLSIAIVPQLDTHTALGSFTFDDGNGPIEIVVTEDMQYGIPPVVDAIYQDFPSHGIYETFFIEIPFTLTGATQAALYDVEDGAGGPGEEVTNGPLYYQAFDVDATGLNDYFLHVDLYTEYNNAIKFAPPSHDLQHVPVPGAVLLGILGLGVAGVKLRKFA